MTANFAFGRTSFLWTAENPAVISLPSGAACSHTCISAASLPVFFRETAVRPWQLSYAVFSADCGPGGLLPTQFRFYLPVAHPCRYHAFYCRQQNLHLRVFSFAHNLSPLMYLLSYIRGDFVYCPVLMVLFRGFCAAPMIRGGITGTRNRRKCRSVSWQRTRCGDCITELPS